MVRVEPYLMDDPAASKAKLLPCKLSAKKSGQEAVAINGVLQWIELPGPAPSSRDARAWLCCH